MVIISDGLYDHHSFDGLFDTIERLASPLTTFLFGYKMRHPLREHEFFTRLVHQLGMQFKVYKQSCVSPVHLRGTGIFIVEGVVLGDGDGV